MNQNKTRWIPVTERLPELHEEQYWDELEDTYYKYKTSGPVLVAAGNQEDGMGRRVAIAQLDQQGGSRRWYEEMGGEISGVTHWRPLPELPEAGT